MKKDFGDPLILNNDYILGTSRKNLVKQKTTTKSRKGVTTELNLDFGQGESI